MADNDESETQRIPRAKSHAGDGRDSFPHKHATPAKGIVTGMVLVDPTPGEPESFEGRESMTPPPADERDVIEESATKIQQRTEAIAQRPGVTPAPESLTAAITIHGVNQKLDTFKSEVRHDFKQVHEKIDGITGKVVTGMFAEQDRRRAEEERRRELEHLKAKKKLAVDEVREVGHTDYEITRRKTDLELETVKKRTWLEIRAKAVTTGLALLAAGLGLLHIVRC